MQKILTADGCIVLYPAPPEAPLSREFTVLINGARVDLYAAPNRYGSTATYGYCDFSGTITVSIEVCYSTIASVQVLPERLHIQPTVEKNSFSFSLEHPEQFTVIVDDEYKGSCLHFFANALEEETIDPEDPNVRYFAPGYHTPENGEIVLTSDQVLYIGGGAFVLARISAQKARNIRILGRGILAQDETCPRNHGIFISDSENIEISGIIENRRRDGWSGLLLRCSGIQILDYKVLSPPVWSTDGLNLSGCSDVLYDHCFFRCGDDNISIKGHGPLGRYDRDADPAQGRSNENIVVQHCQFWSDNNNAVVVGQESIAREYRNICFRDCDILFVRDDEPRKGAMAVICLNGTQMHGITFEDIRIGPCGHLINIFFTENIFDIPGNQHFPGSIHDITFRNIAAVGSNTNSIRLRGWSADKIIEHVIFDNLTIQGRRIESTDDPHFDMNEFIGEIQFY